MTMTPRERMLAAIEHRSFDRVPTDIWMTEEVRDRLVGHFGSMEVAAEELHIDGMPGVGPAYVGPAVPDLGPEESTNFWGMRHRKVRYATGTYSEQYHFPLAEATTSKDLDAYPWPSPDWFDYSGVKAAAVKLRGRQVVMSGYMAPFYFHNLLRGLERSLMDPFDDADLTHEIVGRISTFFYEHHRRIFESADGMVDVSQVTDDYGSQAGPLISMETFREFYQPHMQRFIDLCHEFGVRVFHHDDGAIRPFLGEFCRMGIDILNPVQHTCPGMEMEGLKRDFGKRLCFHGAIDNQKVLPFGTVEEVRAEVRHAIDALAADGTGYILAPCHNLQAVTPVENIVAMYDEAHRYGAR
jgi:uroporphyrinogen decarboxylase